jgi:hypothetical protein
MAAGDGLVTMTPTSITHAGTSAAIQSDGSVDFTAVTSLSLNGVFTSSFDNYLIVFGAKSNGVGAEPNMLIRMRVSATDASGSNYTYQTLIAASTTVSGARSSSQTEAQIGRIANTQSVLHIHMYGPYLAQPTAARGVIGAGKDSAYIIDCAATHSLSTSYDSITIYPSSDNMTGNIAVFGYEE